MVYPSNIDCYKYIETKREWSRETSEISIEVDEELREKKRMNASGVLPSLRWSPVKWKNSEVKFVVKFDAFTANERNYDEWRNVATDYKWGN